MCCGPDGALHPGAVTVDITATRTIRETASAYTTTITTARKVVNEGSRWLVADAVTAG